MRIRVRAALLETLPSGDASIEVVATKLAISKRTLQRRLGLEETTFSDVLDETRRELALYYIRNTEYPVAEFSFLLGYAEVTSLYRAFHRWTELTPDEMRRSESKTTEPGSSAGNS